MERYLNCRERIDTGLHWARFISTLMRTLIQSEEKLCHEPTVRLQVITIETRIQSNADMLRN